MLGELGKKEVGGLKKEVKTEDFSSQPDSFIEKTGPNHLFYWLNFASGISLPSALADGQQGASFKTVSKIIP